MSSTGNFRTHAPSLLTGVLLLAASLAPAPASAKGASHAARTASARGCANAATRAHSAIRARHARLSARTCRSHTHAAAAHDAATPAPRAEKAAHPRPPARARTIVKHAKHPAAAPATPAPSGEAPEAETTPESTEASPATIAQVLATPCQNTEVTPEASNMALVRGAVLCLINHKRAENGEGSLVPSTQLEAAAESHCQEMIADDYFAHVSPSGETPVERIRDTGYIPNENVGYVIGENLAWGTYQLSTPASIVAAWIASPGHLANILEAKYRDTGIAITPAVPSSLAPGAPGATYAQEFGVIVP